jgi:hypothetical protein
VNGLSAPITIWFGVGGGKQVIHDVAFDSSSLGVKGRMRRDTRTDSDDISPWEGERGRD